MKFNVYSYVFVAEVVIEGQMPSCQKLQKSQNWWGVACLYTLKGLGKDWSVRKACRLLIKQGSAVNN